MTTFPKNTPYYIILSGFLFNTVIFILLGLLNLQALRNLLFLGFFFITFLIVVLQLFYKKIYLSKTITFILIIYLFWFINLILAYFITDNSLIVNSSANELERGIRHELIVLLLSLDYLCIGLVWRQINKLKYFKIITMTAIFLLVCTVVSVLGFSSYSMTLDYYRSSEKDTSIGYQALGDSLGFLGICISFDKDNKILNTIIAFFILIALFVIGSRASFFSYLIPLFIFFCKLFNLYEFLLSKFSIKTLFAFSIIIFILYLLTPWFEAQFNNDLILNNRNLELLSQGHSSSLTSRNYLFYSAIKDFHSYFYLGNFMGQIKLHGSYGAYIHNFLDFLYQFGIIPFICYLYLLLYLIFSYKMKVMYREFPSLEYLTYFCLLESLFFRSHSYPYIFILFGIAVSFQKKLMPQQKFLKNVNFNG